MDVQADRIKTLLRDLIGIYSPSGKEEEAVDYVARYLESKGLTPIRQAVDENRFNLLLLPADSHEMDLCFVGHLDTVAAWDLTDFGPREDADSIFGLGAADMKAGCAAMIEAFTVLSESGAGFPRVGMALVVGEEEDSIGARRLIDEYSFPWAVIGEPTNLAPCLGHYGYLEVLLRTRGKRAHSSMPELGQNAIENMLKLLLKVTQYLTSISKGLVYNVRQLSGFPGAFVVPDVCEAWLDLHLSPNSRTDKLKTELEQLVESAGNEIAGLDAYIRFEDTYPGYRISQKRSAMRKLKGVMDDLALPWQPQDFRSHSDGNVLWAGGADAVVLGPGRLNEAHAPDEWVSFPQVVQAAQLYLNFARSLR